METKTVTLQLPVQVYADLEALAAETRTEPIDVITRLVENARKRQDWLNDWRALREQIERDGVLNVGTTQDEIVERLRQTRREIFEVEYAHLYR